MDRRHGDRRSDRLRRRVVRRATPRRPTRSPTSISLRMSTRENIGYGIDQAMFDRLVAQMPPELIPQNIDGLFLEGPLVVLLPRARSTTCSCRPPRDACRPRRVTATCRASTRPDLRLDVVASSLMPPSPRPCMGVFAPGTRPGGPPGPSSPRLSPPSTPAYNGDGHTSCATGVDTTGFGGTMFRDSLPIPCARSSSVAPVGRS